MKALVHSTGATMTWALGYYRAFKFEISKNSADDMILDEVVDLAAGGAVVTFSNVLDAMLKAAAAGYTELMIVAHGSPKGLIMPMGPGLHSADKDNLPAMSEMARVVLERDRIRQITDAKQQLAEWTKLLGRVAGSALPGGATWGPMTQTDLAGVKSAADAEQWLNTISPTVNGHAILQDAAAMRLLTLRNQVAALKLKRVEVRACNLGRDPDGMKALREFLAVDRVLAPMVKTFYAHVTPTLILNDRDYIHWLKRNAPWLLSGRPEPLGTRTYVGDDLFLNITDKDATPLAVLKLVQPDFQTCVGVAGKAGNYAMIQLLVRNNLDVKNTAGYHAGSFFVGGLDPVAGTSAALPPPASANGKAFLLASEPEYRDVIVST